MTFLSSLDAKDRRLMLCCLGIALGLAVLTGFLLPGADSNNNLDLSCRPAWRARRL